MVASLTTNARRGCVTPYPAVFAPSVDLHAASIVRVLEQAVVLEEQPRALSEALALVLVVLLDQLLHQLEQALGVARIPLDQVLNEMERREWLWGDLKGTLEYGIQIALGFLHFRVVDKSPMFYINICSFKCVSKLP